MQQSGSITVQAGGFSFIPLTILDIDPLNPFVRANRITFTANIPEGANGTLKIYDVIPDQSGVPPVWMNPVKVYEVVDGLVNGSNVFTDAYPSWLGQQEVWSLVIFEGGEQPNPISISYTTEFPYPPQIPEKGFWYTYTDPATGYQIGLLRFTADNKIDLNNRAIINQG